jgi:hypothetical protein
MISADFFEIARIFCFSQKCVIFGENFGFRENVREIFGVRENFCETKFRKISRKLAHFRMIFAFS